MNPNHDFEPVQDTYQTGPTRPPKSYGGVIAFLLVLVIFLCGVSTALGLMNIRLLDSLKQTEEETSPVAFSGTQNGDTSEAVSFPLGFSGQEIPELWCLYQALPQGIYITDVAENSDAAKKGVLPGDILLTVDGEPVMTPDQLSALLEDKAGQVHAVFSRDGALLEMTLKILEN